MKVLIIGGAGMVGQKLAQRLAKDGSLGGKTITATTRAQARQLLDVAAAEFAEPPAKRKRKAS